MPDNLEIQRISNLVGELLRSYIAEHVPPDSAIGFSGGLDSSLIFFLSGYRLKAYNVSFTGSVDFKNATSTADMLNSSFRHINLGDVDIQRHIELIRALDPQIRMQELGYELVLSILLESADEKHVVTGQGSDELFYGYRRFIDEVDLGNEDHLRKLHETTLPREKKIADRFGKILITPYLDSGIPSVVMHLGRDYHIDGNTNKMILRRAALDLGYPEELVNIPKKAAQYGSGISSYLRHLRNSG